MHGGSQGFESPQLHQPPFSRRDCRKESRLRMTQTPNPEITLTVAGCPPAKSEAKSIFSKGHPHHSRAIDLLREMKRTLEDNPRWDRMEERPVGLELVIVETPGQACQSDATNFLGGAADTLQANRYKGGDVPSEFAPVSLFRDDSQIREVRYSVESGDALGYRLRVWVLRD